MRGRGRSVPCLVLVSCALLLPTPAHASAPVAAPALDPIHAPSATADPYSLVVTTAGAALGAGSRAELEAAAGVGVESVIPLGGRTFEVTWQQEPAQAPTALAAEVMAGPSFASASPNSRVMPLEVAPMDPGDPRFAEQWNLWDSAAPFGGWSLRTPAAWRTQQGSADVVVAVVDTGIIRHPDLDAAVVAGYDFVTDLPFANDGDGRDPDPSDPGDWVDAQDRQDAAYQGCGTTASTWHGSHVAGIIAAQGGNAAGVVGVAPGVRVQPLRALAKCGGALADVIAAVNWAAGVPVAGLPVNQTPADIINLSLGAPGACSVALQAAVGSAVGRGINVVAAAGNSAGDVSGTFPANCAGVTAVAAAGRDGSRAAYSNLGPGITITAPGGSGAHAILSTVDTGTTVPVAAGYATKSGTSMAAPHVAGALALVRSAFPQDAATQAMARLTSAARGFPAGTVRDCTTATCGAGLLDLNGVLPPPAAGGISGRVLLSGEPVDLADLAVIPAGDQAAARWYDVSDATGGYEVLGLPRGAYRVLARPRAGAESFLPGVPQWTASACILVDGSVIGGRDIDVAGVPPGTPVQIECADPGPDPDPTPPVDPSPDPDRTPPVDPRATGGPTAEPPVAGPSPEPTTAATPGAVARVVPALSLRSRPSSTRVGSRVTLTATLSPAAATGWVTFRDSGHVLGRARISAGRAVLVTKRLFGGRQQVVADFAGSATLAPVTSAPLRITVRDKTRPRVSKVRLRTGQQGMHLAFRARDRGGVRIVEVRHAVRTAAGRGPWSIVQQLPGTARTWPVPAGAAGAPMCARVRAIDWAGRTSRWVTRCS
jgi:serine protease